LTTMIGAFGGPITWSRSLTEIGRFIAFTRLCPKSRFSHKEAHKSTNRKHIITRLLCIFCASLWLNKSTFGAKLLYPKELHSDHTSCFVSHFIRLYQMKIPKLMAQRKDFLARFTQTREKIQSLGEHLMNERDGNRSFAHSRRDALDVASANVAHGEYSRQARLK